MNLFVKYKKYFILSVSFILMSYSLLRRILRDEGVLEGVGLTVIIGVLVVFIGIALMFISFRNLVVYKARQLEKGRLGLVTTGIYSRTRNPIYLSMWIIFLGIFLLIPGWDMFVAFLCFCRYLHIRVLEEEAELAKRYGRDYSDYCSKVNRYFPL